MPTPSIDTKVQSETLKEVAHGIVEMFYGGADYPSRPSAYRRVLTALRNERERAAKVADKQADSLRRAAHVVQQPTSEALRMAELAIVSVENVARAIRKES